MKKKTLTVSVLMLLLVAFHLPNAVSAKSPESLGQVVVEEKGREVPLKITAVIGDYKVVGDYEKKKFHRIDYGRGMKFDTIGVSQVNNFTVETTDGSKLPKLVVSEEIRLLAQSHKQFDIKKDIEKKRKTVKPKNGKFSDIWLIQSYQELPGNRARWYPKDFWIIIEQDLMINGKKFVTFQVKFVPTEKISYAITYRGDV